MLYCDGVKAACRVVCEMFLDVNVTVAGPPCVFQDGHKQTTKTSTTI